MRLLDTEVSWLGVGGYLFSDNDAISTTLFGVSCFPNTTAFRCSSFATTANFSSSAMASARRVPNPRDGYFSMGDHTLSIPLALFAKNRHGLIRFFTKD